MPYLRRSNRNKVTKVIIKENFGSIIWEFHEHDKDHKPSVPHGHSVNSKIKYKLDVFSGDIFDETTGTKKSKVRRKEMLILYRNRKFQECFDEANRWYAEKYPKKYKELGYPKELPIRRLGYAMRSKILSTRRVKRDDTFCVIFPSNAYLNANCDSVRL